jgi:hypothetical protein
MSSNHDTAVKDEAAAQDAATEDAATTDNNSSEAMEDDQAFEQGFDADGESSSQRKETEGEPSPGRAEETKQKTDGTSRGDEAPEEPEEPPEGVSAKAQDRYRSLANERNDYRQRAEQLQQQIAELQGQSEQYGQEQDLMNEVNPETGDYYTPAEIDQISWQANREHQNESRQQQMANLQIQQNRNNAAEDSERTLKDFPMFDESSGQFNEKLAGEYNELLGDHLFYMTHDGQQASANDLLANNIDPSTQMFIGSNASPYKLAKTIAGATHANDARNRAAAQRNTERMLANADTGGAASQSQPRGKSDPFEEGFDSVS